MYIHTYMYIYIYILIYHTNECYHPMSIFLRLISRKFPFCGGCGGGR